MRIALRASALCLDCEHITNEQTCECGSGALLALYPILNRPEGYRRTFDARLYSRGYLLAQVPESRVQAAVLQWLRVHGVQADAVDAGGKQHRASVGGRGGGAGSTIAGFPDITGTLPGGRSLYLEVKAPQWIGVSDKTGRDIQVRAAGEASTEQLAFLDRMRKAGAVVGIAWSTDDAEQIVRSAL